MNNQSTPFLTVWPLKQILLALLLLANCSVAFTQIVYVDKNATGTNYGFNWANACKTLQVAVAIANADPSVKEVRVAAGTYAEPALQVLRNYTISGSWDKNSNTQDIYAHPTILDGQQQHRHMTVSASVTALKLHSLVFRNGANLTGNAGSILNEGIIELTRCHFLDNMLKVGDPAISSELAGNAGAILSTGSVTINECLFSGNGAERTAGVIWNKGNLTITKSEFRNNVSRDQGGAIRNDGKLKVHSSKFGGNYLGFQGSVGFTMISRGGAIYSNKEAEIISCIFDKNKAHDGGAINAYHLIYVLNCTFYRNESYLGTTTPTLGGAIYHRYMGSGKTEAFIYNNIFKLNVAQNNRTIYVEGGGSSSQSLPGSIIRNNSIEDGNIRANYYSGLLSDMADNYNLEPFFFDAEGGNFMVMPLSLCKDRGNTDAYVGRNYPGSDYFGQLRISGCIIDIGAHEVYQPIITNIKPDNNGILYVNPSSTYVGIGDMGSSWDKALNSWSVATTFVNICPGAVEIRLARGMHKPTRQTLIKPVIIRGGFDPVSGEQNWVSYPTFVDGNLNERILYLLHTTGKTYIEGCIFQNAKSYQGLSNGSVIESKGPLEIAWCRFGYNLSEESGGAIANYSDLTIRNTEFYFNAARVEGGAILNESNLKIVNCSFFGNNSGGVGRSIKTGAASKTFINNSIITGAATAEVVNGDYLRLDHNIISNVQGGTIEYANDPSTDCLNTDPLFINPAFAILNLKAGSPAINAGSNSEYEFADGDGWNQSLVLDKDLGYKTRNFSDVIDLGANERQMLQQSITATDITAVYGDAPIDPATSTSSLPKTYQSADNTVAQGIIDAGVGKIQIRNKGVAAIEVSQAGDATHDPAKPVFFNLTITPKPVTVTADPQSKIYGETDPAFTYTVSPALVAGDVFSNTLIRQAGENAGMYAIKQGNLTLGDNYTISFVSANLTIGKMSIAVAAENKSKTYGDDDPAFTYSITPSLINGDLLNGTLDRTPGEGAGQYPITIGNLDHPNYAINFTPAMLTIGKANQQISWTQSLVSHCDGNAVLVLNATSSSGLPISYQSSNTAIATVNGNQLTVVSPGRATIDASQAGDNNFFPATAVSNNLLSRLPASLIKKHWDDVMFFDNSSKLYTAWQWYKNGQPVNGANGQYFYETGKLNGSYHAEAKNTAGLMLPTCPVALVPGTNIFALIVSPNPAKASQQVTVKTAISLTELQGATIALYNLQGVELSAIQNLSQQTSVTLPAFPGLYVLKLKLASGEIYSTNVLVKP